MKKRTWLLIAVIIIFISACGGTEDNSGDDPQAGQALFQQGIQQGAPACASCHSLEPGKLIIGPSLAGVASRAGERKPGMSAEAYLRESILDPNAYVVEGFAEGIMYQKFKDALTEDQVDALVAFLLTLE